MDYEKEYNRVCNEYIPRVQELEEDNKKLKEERDFFKEQAILWRNDYKNKYEENRKLKEDIDNGFKRETDLRNKRADSLLENKDLRDKIEELDKEIEGLNKMMLFETELEK